MKNKLEINTNKQQQEGDSSNPIKLKNNGKKSIKAAKKPKRGTKGTLEL